MNLKMPVDLIGKLVEKKKLTEGPLISPRVPVVVIEAPDTNNAYKAGLRKGDLIVGIDSINTAYYDEFSSIMKNKKKGDEILLSVKRHDSMLTFKSVVQNNGQVGFIAPNQPEQYDSLGIYKYSVKK